MRHKLHQTLAFFLTLTMLTCPALAVSPFPDVDENAEYAEAVEYLKERSIMVGDSNGNFNPNQIVTRAEMATIICRMLDETGDLSVSDRFTDVPVTHWANKYVAKAAELGIVSGYGNGKFGPSDTVTFEQAVTMIVRAMDMGELATTAGGYPKGFLLVASEQGMTRSMDFQIGDPLDRASVAKIIYNTLEF